MIPPFNNKGHLPNKIHLASGEEFLKRFCDTNYRKPFEKQIADIFDWVKSKGGRYLFVSGSFIRKPDYPQDFDCLIVFSTTESIPSRSEMLTIENTKFDIICCSADEPEMIDGFLTLFSQDRYGNPNGIIQIDLYDENNIWKIRHEPDYEKLEIIKKAYIYRHYTDHYEPNGVLVTIHGLYTQAKWNAVIAPIASSQGWIVAPYLYNDNNANLILRKSKRKAQIEDFREWIYNLQTKYYYPISIIAHSFGTYIVASYISGFEEFSPVCLNSLILTGSIINECFDWNKHRSTKVSRVLNEICPEDQWIKYIGFTDFISQDKLFGKSGYLGFVNDSPILTQRSNPIFDHNNTITEDVVSKYWLPFLQINKDAQYYESHRYFLKHI